MSGIVGIVNVDGEPVDRSLLLAMTSSLTFRGPDAQNTWINGSVGFGHTLLKTTYEAERERQPVSFDGEIWIVADARVDARPELIATLRSRGREASLDRPDVELILEAYHRWGMECVEHLLGDFTFGIWDARRRRLFCARDHRGVKPFYYAHIGSTVVFSNTLDCVRLHPMVSGKLNDLAIADFILFGFNQDSATTSFADVARLPAAHTFQLSDEGPRLRRYWTLPIDEPLYLRQDQEYGDRLLELTHAAVSDRLRTNSVSVFMSGGLDSTALAASAVELVHKSRARDPVQAFTLVYDHLIPDDERYFARLAADHLRIPIHFFVMDQRTEWAEPGSQRTPEPIQDLLDPGIRMHSFQAVARHSRVLLYGEGPDNALMYEWRPYVSWLARQGRWGRLALDVGKHFLHHRRIPILPTLPRMFKDWQRTRQWEPSFPDWLNSEFIEAFRLRERWAAMRVPWEPQHPVRPLAYSSLLISSWQQMFEEFEPSYTESAIEFRYPFMDIRLLRFLLRVPAVPWCRKKLLLRRAFRGKLPRALLDRPKTPLQKNPDFERAQKHGLPLLARTPQLVSYGLAQPPAFDGNIANVVAWLRFSALGYWLHHLSPCNRIEARGNYEHAEAGARIA